MNAKRLLFVSSIVFVAIGVAAMSTLGIIAKVPSAEYWAVVLGSTVAGLIWLGLITTLHFTSKAE